MDFAALIRSRESVRSYDPERPVPREVLMRILEAGRLAPSAANRQPWTLCVVQSPAVLARVRLCYSKPWFQQAPQILIVKGRRKEAWTRSYDGYNALETDLTIVMDHLILAAENEGVATCWIAAFDPAVLKTALPLSEDEQVFALTPLGYPLADYQKKGIKTRKPLDQIIAWM